MFEKKILLKCISKKATEMLKLINKLKKENSKLILKLKSLENHGK